MRLHGGRIGIWSEGEGKGSTFLVDLPILRHNLVSNIIAVSPIPIETLSFEVRKSSVNACMYLILMYFIV